MWVKNIRCPECGAVDFNIIGTKGSILRSLGTQLLFGGLGNIVAGKKAIKNISSDPIQYKCRKCKHKFLGELVEAAKDEILAVPCSISLKRVSNMLGAVIPQIVYLNGVKICAVKNGQTVTFPTHVKQNIIFVTDPHGAAFPGHYKFDAQPGTSVQVCFNRQFSNA